MASLWVTDSTEKETFPDEGQLGWEEAELYVQHGPEIC